MDTHMSYDNSRAFIGYDTRGFDLPGGPEEPEPPEDCPVCHQPNVIYVKYEDELEEYIPKPAFPYCSRECEAKDSEAMRQADDALYEALQNEKVYEHWLEDQKQYSDDPVANWPE
jgi:hypothetical protein